MASRTGYDAVAGTTLTAANLDLNPRGWVGYITSTGATGSISTSDVDVSGLTVTFTADSTRVYRVSFMLEVTSTSTGSVYVVKVTDGSNVEKHRSTGVVITGTVNESATCVYLETGLSGSTTRKVRASVTTGTGTAGGSVGTPSQLIIEDMGAA